MAGSSPHNLHSIVTARQALQLGAEAFLSDVKDAVSIIQTDQSAR